MDIYLDNAATTKPKQEVIDAMMPYFTDKWYNPSSLYSNASTIKNEIQNAKKEIADYINAQEDEIYFTSGGSESNCWAIQGFINHCRKNNKCPAIVTSTIEHKSIIECVNNVNANVFFVDVDKYGFVIEENLSECLGYLNESGYTTLVSIQMANNEIGTVQYIKRLSNIVHSYGAIFHTDAVQAFGKMIINVDYYYIDLMSVSGHKFGCPKGIGFLYIRNGIEIEPLIYGTQMNGMRGGTENVPYIIGMAKAVELLSNLNKNPLTHNFVQSEMKHFLAIAKLNNALIDKFGCKINGATSNLNRVHGIMSYRFPDNIHIESLILMLDMDEIYISAGSACNTYTDKPSHVLKAIGLSDEECKRTMRLSFEYNSLTEEKVDRFINSLENAINIMRADVEL